MLHIEEQAANWSFVSFCKLSASADPSFGGLIANCKLVLLAVDCKLQTGNCKLFATASQKQSRRSIHSCPLSDTESISAAPPLPW